MKTNIVNPWYYNRKIIGNIERFIEQHNIKRIYLDMDGVLIHSCQAICDMINEIQGTNFTGDEVLSWNFQEICPNLTDDDVERLFADPIFFQYVKWINGALEFVKKYEHCTWIVTKGTWMNLHCKEQFLEEYGISHFILLGMNFNQSKGDVDMNMVDSLFIDDCTNNLNESNAKYKIMFKEYNDDKEREWQKDWNGLVMYNWT